MKKHNGKKTKSILLRVILLVVGVVVIGYATEAIAADQINKAGMSEYWGVNPFDLSVNQTQTSSKGTGSRHTHIVAMASAQRPQIPGPWTNDKYKCVKIPHKPVHRSPCVPN